MEGKMRDKTIFSANSSYLYSNLPPLPSYTLTPQPDLLPFVPDWFLPLILPIIAYWALSLVYHLIDVYDIFPQYRLHTPAEVLKRNHVSRYEVLRDVILQQVIQTIFGLILAMFDEPAMIGREEYDVALWARRFRIAESYIPSILGAVGLDAKGLATRVARTMPALSFLLNGGGSSISGIVPYTDAELGLAKFVYWYAVPAVQFVTAVIFMDTWQYFLHRAMHMNKWLYTTLHSRHHRLYVPYAYGALYNHPIEGFMLDTAGAGLGYLLTGMTYRQSMWFYTCSTIKTVDDHCGYAFPWDPLQHLTSNNAGYHDIHHQSWGIKTNFSQPFFIFWDRLLGTQWTGGDVSARYERAKLSAQQKVDLDTLKSSDSDRQSTISKSLPEDSKSADPAPYSVSPTPTVPKSLQNASVPSGKAHVQALDSQQQILEDPDPRAGGVKILAEEASEESSARRSLRQSIRRRNGGGSFGQIVKVRD